MHVTTHNVLIIVLWAVVACAVVWLVTLPIRRMSLGGVLASVVLTGTVAIADEYGGIAADDLPRLFEVGFRGEPGGDISVANTALGCRFTITLPLPPAGLAGDAAATALQ